MKLTYNNQTINFFDFNLNSKKVILSLSGGCDSAAALFLICKHFPEIEIFPLTARDENAPKDAEAATQIVKFLQQYFPESNLKNIHTYNFNDRTEKYVSFKTCRKLKKKNHDFKDLTLKGISKIIQLDKINDRFSKKYKGAIRIDGMTKNPPTDEMLDLGFFNIAERRRDKGAEIFQLSISKNTIIYKPFINVDKKFIAGIYKDNNLEKTLLPLTRSCVGTADQTDNFTRECQQCFWCCERNWAFRT